MREAERKIELLIEQSTISDWFTSIIDIFRKKHVSFLTNDQFEDYARLMRNWFYHNRNFGKDFEKKDRKLAEVIKVINAKNKLPNKPLYRGVSFKTKKELDNFLKIVDSGVVDGGYRGKTFFAFTSWTLHKKVAESFMPGGKFSNNQEYGVLLKLTPNEYKGNILFSLVGLFKNQKEKVEHLASISEYTNERNIQILKKADSLKKIDNHQLFGLQYGVYYGLVEDEVILRPMKFKTPIHYTLSDKYKKESE